MPTSTSSIDPSKLRSDLRTQGFTILPSSLPAPLVARLLTTSKKLTTAARAGHWPHIRTCPKQFPPWPDKPGDEGIWGVQHLLHPGLWSGENAILTRDEAATFTELYFSEELLQAVRAILEVPDHPNAQAKYEVNGKPNGDADAAGSAQTEEESLTMELLNLLISPPQDFSLRWHRDNVSFDQSIEEEAAALGLIQQSYSEDSHNGYQGQGESHNQGHSGAHGHGGGHSNPFASTEHTFYTLHPAFRQKGYTQYNIPLTHDRSLHLIPGSHLRPRTPAEATLLKEDPWSNEMQGWIEVVLQPGDIVFYDNNLIHRGVYKGLNNEGEERYTLHGSISRKDCSTDRARNVLQHGVGSWIEGCDFGDLLANVLGKDRRILRQRAEGMKRNLLQLGRSNGGEEGVGYAHHD